MEHAILATESFSNHRKHYFLDFKHAANNSHYIKITRNDEQEDQTYRRSGSVVIFEEDFEFLIEAFSSLFRTAAYQRQTNGRQGELFGSNKEAHGIKSWDPACRPREKLIAQGREAMADAELLAMLIGSGTPGETAVQLARRILASVNHDLQRLAALPVEDLCRFYGMGHARSLAIISAMELGLRLMNRHHKGIWLRPVKTGDAAS